MFSVLGGGVFLPPIVSLFVNRSRPYKWLFINVSQVFHWKTTGLTSLTKKSRSLGRSVEQTRVWSGWNLWPNVPAWAICFGLPIHSCMRNSRAQGNPKKKSVVKTRRRSLELKTPSRIDADSSRGKRTRGSTCIRALAARMLDGGNTSFFIGILSAGGRKGSW